MNSRLVLSPLAQEDLEDSARWYEGRQPGLGSRFLEAVGSVIERIQENPYQYQSVSGSVRRALTTRFPYAVYFEVEAGEATVLAVLHLHRQPGSWDR